MSGLISRQWEAYPRYHQARRNLLLHIAAVPVFLLANVALVAAMVLKSWVGVAIALAAMVASIGAQGRGHGWEPIPTEPFGGAVEALARIFCEQWITFPRFVLAGRWSDALRRAS